MNNAETDCAYNIHKKIYPASTTKILTALVALENGNLSDTVTVADEADSGKFAADEQTCGIKAGDQLTLEDLLNGLLLYSGNDNAVAIADHIAGSTEKFAEMMNAEAKKLMATNSHFVNPSGLHDDNHYTTAYDLYLIFNECIKHDDFVKIINSSSYTAHITGADGTKRDVKWEPTNYYAKGEATPPDNVTIIGGKTGTADKGKTGDVVVSFVAFAPADDPQIIMLIAMDSPARDTGTYPSGGAMVAPVASKVMAEILPYLGIEPTYTAEELMGADTTVPYVVGMTREEAQQRVKDRGFGCQIIGDGDTITDQTPAGGAIIPGNATVILYAGAEKATELCTVPNLLGRTASEANSLASNAGLILRFTGATNSTSGSIVVLNQDVEAGAQVEPGTVISVQLGDTSLND